jgi:protein-tyrosine phosphatase
MAHGVFRDKAAQLGVDVVVESAGTSAFHAGEAPDARAPATLAQKGIDISDLRSQQIVTSDFETYDFIVTMDQENQNNVMQLAKEAGSNNLPKMLMNFAYPGKNISVPDPYYGGQQGFEDVYQMVDLATENLMNELNK